MPQTRLARISLLLAAIGLNAAFALPAAAFAQDKPAAQAEAPKDTVRPEIFKLVDPAQIKPLMDAKNYAEVKSRLAQADALPNRTVYEDFVLNRMRISLGSATNNTQMTTTALEAVINANKLQPSEQRDFIAAMFGDGTASDPHHGRYNVLLLGGDSGADRWGMRPDSITVASIDEETGHTILFGLPRNMQNFPFPEGSVMAEQFPDGYDCDDCYLNSLSTFAADNKQLFAEHDNPGVEATIEGVEGITGLDINYYAMVNLEGFRSLVTAVGGLELNVRDRIPIGGGGGPVTGYIEPGVKRLDGFETLWFARSRSGDQRYSTASTASARRASSGHRTISRAVRPVPSAPPLSSVMPPIATETVHSAGAATIASFINGLTGDTTACDDPSPLLSLGRLPRRSFRSSFE